MIFWDTSALVKCYAALEADHARAKNLLRSKTEHAGSVLLRPELMSAFIRRLGRDRRVREALLATIEDHLTHFHLVLLGEAQLDKSVVLIKRHALRAADAIHLAAAMLLARDLGRRSLRFTTADALQAKAAREEGLQVTELGG